MKERIQDAVYIINLSAEELKNPLYFLDIEQLNNIINNIKKNQNVVSVYIIDPGGRVITDGTSENRFYNQKLNDDFGNRSIISDVLIYETHNDVLQISAPIVIIGKIGMVRMVFSLSELEQVSRKMNVLTGLIGVAIFLMIATINIFTTRSISVPIIKLRDVADEIGRGNLDANIEIKSKDEIGELATAFNKMVHDLKRSNDETIASEEKYKDLFENASDAIFILDSELNYKDVNKKGLELLGYSREELLEMNVCDLIPPEQIPRSEFEFEKLRKNGSYKEFIGKIRTKNGKLIDIDVSSSAIINGGKIVGSRDILRDITERKRLEENILKSLQEKEVLLREIHHRVKNNMQIISSLLMLQSQYARNKKNDDIFLDSQNRILSMSLVHEKLYQSNQLAKIDFREYIEDLVSGLFHSYGIVTGNIALNMNVKNISLPIDSAIPCGLIINELVTNSLKYAFPEGMKGEINISLRRINDNMMELVVADNGTGIPKNIDFRKTESFGLHLVTILAENQLHGEIDLNRSNGTEFLIKFKG